MVFEPLPLIKVEDYEAFRRIVRDLLSGYDEWREKIKGERQRLEGLSHTVRYIPVDPHAFDQFCNDRKKEGSKQELLRFVRDEAANMEAASNANQYTVGFKD